MYKHQNITSVLVITIVFGIQYNLFNYKFVDLMNRRQALQFVQAWIYNMEL